MGKLLEVRGLTVELPTAAGWVRPVNEVSLRIAVMRAGKFLEIGDAEQVLHQPQHDYTRELLSAVPALPHD